MRVKNLGSALRSRLRNDDGATLAMVAGAMIVIMGAAALTVDLGNGWRTRRSLIPATDAAALAAAQDIVLGQSGPDACTTAQSYVGLNSSGATNVVCVSPFPLYYNGDQGQVTVTADHNVQTWFAPVIGSGDYTVTSASTAVFGPPAAVTGLRPIGLCFAGSSALQNLVNNPPAVETLLRIEYTKDQVNACAPPSVMPGNWGTVDFNGGGPSNSDTKQWVENGYPDPVTFENHSVASCSLTEAHCYEGDTGNLNGVNKELADLRDSGQYFTVPIFNHAQGNGAATGGKIPALLHLMGVLRVRLVAYSLTGNTTDYFEFMVKPGLITGTCCGAGSGASGNKVITICAVDLGDYDACDP